MLAFIAKHSRGCAGICSKKTEWQRSQWLTNLMISLSDGAAGEIRTPEVRHHRISNPAQWQAMRLPQ